MIILQVCNLIRLDAVSPQSAASCSTLTAVEHAAAPRRSTVQLRIVSVLWQPAMFPFTNDDVASSDPHRPMLVHIYQYLKSPI